MESTDTTSKSSDDLAHLVQELVSAEWDQFQEVNNEGGRANCQGNWPTFFQMRASQFMTWNRELMESYRTDLAEAVRTGRNLLTEKYGLMMSSTDPEYYHRELEAYMPHPDTQRTDQQEKIIAQQVEWADSFRSRYPKLGAGMRVLRTGEDTLDATSFETYLRAELTTYSQHTLDLYQAMIERKREQGVNLTEETITNTIHIGGFETLEAAETAQAGGK